MSRPIPGDISPDEVDRIMRDARLVLRRQGPAALDQMTFVRADRENAPRQKTGAATDAVIAALTAKPQTVYDLAARLRWTFHQVHGVMCWLRKCQRIQVKYWTTSAKGRRVAVYQVKQG